MKTEPNDTAFAYGTDNYDHKGLTKREHFAGLAMQGLLSTYIEAGLYGNHPSCPMVAEEAVRQSDLLIAELNKEKTQ